MKRDDRKRRDEALQKANVLVEAMPWIHRMNGRTVVVKYGGAAMEDPSLCKEVIADIELLKLMGMRVVLVHGGGKAINRLLTQLDLPVSFKDGLRVTDDATMEAVAEVLIGKVNQELVWALNEFGPNAVGISGADGKTLSCTQVDPDLGHVGEVTKVNTGLIESVLEDGYIPVIASVGCGPEGLYNINADIAASKIAQALGAHTLAYLTDVDGLYGDIDDEESLISSLNLEEAHLILESGGLTAGMIPKITSIVEALESGVHDVRIMNGTFPHALLLECFTDAGIGTVFYRD
ncbi:MAG: acetylglutamate kinase [Atopobiaceae bacterium]|jgi:acetylglutamate kinase|nr:acetylglutamate kinase [Atopobiaceae bacterium]